MKMVSRRNFLKGTAAGALTLSLGALLHNDTAKAEAPSSFERSIAWRGLYDVIVLGEGFAGLAAAITAADAGAKVLILEKGPNGLDGGNSRYCHQSALGVYDGMVDQAKTYYRAMRRDFNFPTDAAIDSYVEELAKNWSWFESLGATPVNYTDFTGVALVGEHPELPGYDSVYCMTLTPELGTGKMFAFLKNQVMDRADKIDLWYSAPATSLIQDPQTQAIFGVTAKVDGQEINLRAKNGVIIATGGYENNKQMVQDYVGIVDAKPVASHFNTGDGITMAAKAGAQLSALFNMMSYINCLYDDGVTAEWDSGSRIAKANYDKSLIYVGGDGTRFTNEFFKSRHGYMPWHGDYTHQLVPSTAWCVFDEKARKETFFSKSHNNGCEEEVASGFFKKADTLEELAAIIDVPAENLVATVARYNQFCENGVDYEFNRDAKALIPLDAEGPFYAFTLVQSVLNTQAGPRRNENGEIVDENGHRIPHLYGAGECGEVYTTLYQGGGNVGGCMASGRIAGRSAAAAKEDAQLDADLSIDAFVLTLIAAKKETGKRSDITTCSGKRMTSSMCLTPMTPFA